MAVLVACLVALRGEFNDVRPGRDKGADGWIGDKAHALTSSDHNPDESGRTPFEDADNVDEVHGLDIDSTGPWPSETWFDSKVKGIVTNHRIGVDDRLQNVIWRGKIASRSWGWEWRDFGGAGHYDHAHFSARYTTAQENDTSAWGVYYSFEGDDMSLAQDLIKITGDTADEIGKDKGDAVSAASLLQLAVIHAHRSAVDARIARENTELILARLGTTSAR